MTNLRHTLRSLKMDRIFSCLDSFSPVNCKKSIGNTFMNIYKIHKHFSFPYWIFYLTRRFYYSRLSMRSLHGTEGPRLAVRMENSRVGRFFSIIRGQSFRWSEEHCSEYFTLCYTAPSKFRACLPRVEVWLSIIDRLSISYWYLTIYRQYR